MGLISCPECNSNISEKAFSCPGCGHPTREHPSWRGYQWKSKTTIYGWPFVHVALGRDKSTGKLLVAKGIIAIGQFGIGLITIAQFGVGVVFGLGQFITGVVAIAQFAGGIYFGLGQFATGITAIGQFAFGKYVLAWIGYGKHVWSPKAADAQAVEYFKNLWESVKAVIDIA